MASAAQGVGLGAWDDTNGREGLLRRWQSCLNHKRLGYSMSWQKSILGGAEALRQESICSRYSKTGYQCKRCIRRA